MSGEKSLAQQLADLTKSEAESRNQHVTQINSLTEQVKRLKMEKHTEAEILQKAETVKISQVKKLMEEEFGKRDDAERIKKEKELQVEHDRLL